MALVLCLLSRAALVTFVLAAFGALLSAPLFGQLTSGVFAGTIRDQTGSVVPGVDIIITNQATGTQVHAQSNESGYYLSVPLIPSLYSIRVSHPGFASIVQENLSLEVDQRAVVNFDLSLGEVTETITVEAAPPLLQSERSSLGNVTTQREVQELPLNGRNFNQLIYLSPGVVPTTDQRTGTPKTAQRGFTGHSTNGLGHEQNNFLIEGIDNQEDNNGLGILFYPNVDAIQEFKVLSSVSSAEFGRGGGGVVNVILRSGGREFHGGVYEFHRNAPLDAKNFFDPTDEPIPAFIRNQFGATLGGPIVLPGGYNSDRSKTFFFLAYEGLRQRQGQTSITTVPTAAFRAGDFSASQTTHYDPLTGRVREPFPDNLIPASRIDRVGKNLIDLYPQPNLPGLANNFLFNPDLIQDGNSFDAKIDHNAWSSDNLSFRFSHSDADITQPGMLPAPAVGGCCSAGTTKNPANQFALTWTHTFSPTKINEFRSSFTRWELDGQVANHGRNLAEEIGIPGVNKPNDPITTGLSPVLVTGFSALGDSRTSPILNVFNHFQFDDSVSIFSGKHSLKLGAHVIRRRFNGFQATTPLGTFEFTGVYTRNLDMPARTGSGLGDLFLGKPQRGEIEILQGNRGLRRTELAFFIQDDYRATSKLTLNVGLRYDVFSPWPWYEVNDRMSNFNFDLGDVFVVNTPDMPTRSGTRTDRNNFGPRFGLAYQLGSKTVVRSAYGIFYTALPNAQNFAPSINPPFVGSFQFVNDQANFADARPASQGFESPTIFPTEGANLVAVPMQGFKSPYTQQWNLTLEHAMRSDLVLTGSYVGTKGTNLSSWADANQPRPGSGAVAPRRPNPRFGNIRFWDSRSNSSYHGLQLMANKRFSGGLMFLASYTYSHAISDIDNWSSAPQDYLNFAAERSNTLYDVRQRFVYSWTYDLPVGRGKKWLDSIGGPANVILGGWQLNGVMTLSDGLPFTVNSSSNTLNGSGAQRAHRIADGRLSGSERTLQRYFDVSAFVVPPSFTFGNAARRLLFGPGTKQIDFSLFKEFPLGAERRYLQFRSEFFNLFNTPQFNNPSACTDPERGCGTITGAGSPPTLQRTSRQIQFGLKFYF